MFGSLRNGLLWISASDYSYVVTQFKYMAKDSKKRNYPSWLNVPETQHYLDIHTPDWRLMLSRINRHLTMGQVEELTGIPMNTLFTYKNHGREPSNYMYARKIIKLYKLILNEGFQH